MELSPDAPKGWRTPRAKTLLFAAIGLMYVYVFVVWACVAAAFPIADLVLQIEELMMRSRFNRKTVT